jgi:hypothetical protein
MNRQNKDIAMRLARVLKGTIVAVVIAGALLVPMAPPANAAVVVGVGVGFAPPAIPIYAQPLAPG